MEPDVSLATHFRVGEKAVKQPEAKGQGVMIRRELTLAKKNTRLGSPSPSSYHQELDRTYV